MTEVIQDFPDYKLVVGKTADGLEYQIINKEYQVIESSTKVLPQALSFIEQLQGLLDAVRDESEDHRSVLANIKIEGHAH